MPRNRLSAIRVCRSYLLLLVALLVSTCSGLAGEPQIVATLPSRPAVVDTGLPSTPPDIAQGAQIYVENCIRCHGPGGQGNGELVLSGQITIPPRDFSDPATTRSQTPTDWFATITNGRLENLMPPWRNSLNEADRWAVALYTYTLNYLPNQLQQGEAVWNASCAECHGESGAGDGPRAGELSVAVGNLARPDALVALSDAAVFEAILEGKGDVMPAFAGVLDDEQVWAVVAYARTLSLGSAGSIGETAPVPAATAEVEIASAAEVVGTISGQVSNATAGGEIPTDLTIRLHIFDSQLNEETLEITSSSDGTFSFSDVTIRDDRAYVVTTAYQGHVFNSRMTPGDASVPALNLPITIYETTDDPGVITISGMVTQVTGTGDSLQVAQIVNFSNSSDRLYAQAEPAAGSNFGSVSIALPPGAQVVNTGGDAQRYILSEDGRRLVDTNPVFPGGDHLVHVVYTLPFQENVSVQLPLNYALDGLVQLLIRPESLRVSSEQLPALGMQTMGGAAFQTYGAILSLSPGDLVHFSVTSSQGSQSSIAHTPNLLAYALIAVGSLSLLVAAALYYLGRRTPTVTYNQQLGEVILEQIAELDDLHAAGKIEPEAYQARRAKLKARLAKILDTK